MFITEIEKELNKNKAITFRRSRIGRLLFTRTTKAIALKQQITTTDHEIDKMVYELYGLIDEEIEIVEKS